MYQELHSYNCSFADGIWPANCGYCCTIRTILIAFLVLGTLGNGIAFTIFMRPALRDVVTTLYYRALVIINMLMLYVGLLPLGALLWVQNMPQTAARALCVTMDTSLTYLMFSEAWTMVMLCCERTFGVLYPHRAMVSWTKKRAFATLAMVAIGCAVITPPEVLFTVEVCNQRKLPVLPATFRLVFHAILPPTLVFACNIAINIRIYRSAESLGANSSTRVLQTSMAKILLSLAFTFLLFATPSTVKSFLYAVSDFHTTDPSTLTTIDIVVTLVFFSNCCIKFIIFRSICPRFSQQCNIFCGLEKPRERVHSLNSQANYSLLEKSISREKGCP